MTFTRKAEKEYEKIKQKLVRFVVLNLPGHSWVLQSFTTLSEPLQVPPFFSVTSLGLVFNIFPPPQDLSQDEKSLQSSHTQGTIYSKFQDWFKC